MLRPIYVREDRIVDRVDEWLGGLFAPKHRDRTIETLHLAAEDPAVAVRRSAVQRSLKSCDDRLGKYRAALEAGADPVTVAGWIAEVTAERTRLGIQLSKASGATLMTKDQIAAIVDQMASLAQLLANAEASDRAEVYRQLGLRLTYQYEPRLVKAEARPDHACTKDGVRGGT